MILLVIALLALSASANNIVSNLPTIVTGNKNYTSAPPIWLTSPFMRANSQAVISSFTGSSQWPFASYTFTYSSPLPGTPNLAYGIQKYRGNDYFGEEFYEIRQTSRTATTFSVQIQIYGWTNLWVLAVAYLAVDPTFPHHLNSFDNVPINYTAGNIVNITSQVDSLKYYVNTINYTAQAAGQQFTQFTTPYSGNYIVLFMTSLWIKGRTGYPVQFHVYPQVVNASHYLWNVTVYRRVMVTNVKFSQIMFNSDDVQSSEQYFIVYSKWYNDMEGGFLQIPQEFVDNFIMGLTTFEATSGNCGHQYQWQFTTKTVNGVDTFGVQMLRSWHINNRCGLSWIESTLFYMMTWQCGGGNPFFNLTTGNCQTACGGFTVQNYQTLTCDKCVDTDCYQCQGNINQCSDCASYLNYELASNSCVCMPSHIHTQDSCQHCSFGSTGCINCNYDDGGNGLLTYNSALFACTQCNNTQNYFLNGTLCTLCTLSNCIYCQNLTHCAVCQANYDYSDRQTCIQCLVTGCTNCSYNNANQCVTCNNTMGYYNNNIQKCSTLCGDGIPVAATQACDDGNLINFDGCSSTCAVQSSFSCSGAPSVCYFASSVTLSIDNQVKQSQVCNTITFGVRFSPPSQTFAQPYINWNNFISSPNDSILSKNASMFAYSGGVLSISYFLLNHLQNETLIFNADFNTLLNNSHIFDQSTASPISFTVSTNPEALMICCDGYFMAYNPIRCQQICGDSILFILACDDGNLISGDGCDSTCNIQPSYVCVNGTPTTSSICSYNGTFTFTVESAFKNPLQNSMQINYILEPSHPLTVLNNNGSRDFSSLVSFPGWENGVTITSAVVDLQSGLLVIEIDYTEHLQDQQLKLQITPPDLPQAFLIPNLTSPWVVQTTNQLAAAVYSEQDYQELQLMALLVNILFGSYLGVVALTCIFRKFIGLQLATLVQLGYLSLLQNTQITLFQQPITDWGYVFGFNRLYFSPLPDQRLASPYHIFGFHQHFGFSNNLMILVAAGVYLLAIIILLLSMLTTNFTHKKLRRAAFLIANQIAYMLVVFSTPNIITALCIEAQYNVIFDSTLLWSKGLLIGAGILLLVAHCLNLATLEENPDVGTFFRKNSKFGLYAPLIFNIRLVAITILLFAYHITPTVPAYFVILVQLSYLVFILFARPHKKLFDLFRSICIQLLLLYLFVMRFVETKVLADYIDFQSHVFPLIAYIEYGVYGFGIVISLISLSYHLLRKFKGKKIENDSEDKKDGIPYMNQSNQKLYPDSSKRGRVKQKTPIFDLQQMNRDETAPGTGTISLDTNQNISPKRMKNRRRRR